MAEDIFKRLLDASIALIVAINVIYGLFIMSRVYLAERNYWEVWVIYPISCAFVLTQAVMCVGKLCFVGDLPLFETAV